MTLQIREEIRVAMVRQRLTQTELAKRVGLSRQHLNHLLTGHRGNLPDGWGKVLDALGLELVVRPKAEVGEPVRFR
ncbi:MAG: helix-turn-helix transcriptional regulator [Trueperaceae bacterium]|nr:helix-turn-helix transcriptional regulator [Trueperaceae bacterium]